MCEFKLKRLITNTKTARISSRPIILLANFVLDRKIIQGEAFCMAWKERTKKRKFPYSLKSHTTFNKLWPDVKIRAFFLYAYIFAEIFTIHKFPPSLSIKNWSQCLGEDRYYLLFLKLDILILELSDGGNPLLPKLRNKIKIILFFERKSLYLVCLFLVFRNTWTEINLLKQVWHQIWPNGIFFFQN